MQGDLTQRDEVQFSRPKRPSHRQNARTSIWMLLIAESMLFFGLISSFFFLRTFMLTWGPPTGREYDLTLPIINSILLFGSAATMHLSYRALRLEQRKAFDNWMLATMLLGAAFVIGQVFEFYAVGFAFQDGAYAGIFHLTIGVHALHVIIGVLIFVVVHIKASMGLVNAQRYIAMEFCAIYWYFVVLMWLVIFAILYFL